MADLNALIAQGAQFNLPNPVDQYSKLTQLQAAQQQMQVQRQQMQQIQEDRAGFAKLREKLAQQNMTPEDYEAALKQSPNPSHQQLGIEMGFKRMQLANLDRELEKARGGGAEPAIAPAEMPVAKTFDTSAVMVQPGKAYADMRPGERIQFDINRLTNPELTKPQAVYQVGGQPVPFGDYVNANIANSAGAGERAAMAAMPNALAAQVAPAAPVANAMTAKQAQLAQIRNELAVLTSPRYSDLDGVKDRVNVLREEQKRLSESPVGKVDIDKFEPESVAKFFETGNFADLKRAETKAGGRYLSLGAGRALDTETGQIIAADKIPTAATAARIVKIGSIPYTVDAEGTLVPVPIQGGLPIVAKGGAGKAAGGGAAKLKAPSGYRYDASGENLEPIPGGPADKVKVGATDIKPLNEAQVIKLRTDIGKDYKNATTALSQIDDLLASATAVKTAPGLSATTGFTSVLPSFPEGAAAQAETRLANLRGKVTALGKATAAMGGAIGSIANQEWKILADQIAVLNEIKGKGPLLEQIALLEEQAKGASERIRDAYEKTRADDFERFPQFRNLPAPKAPGGALAASAGGFKYLGKESK